MHSTPPRYSKLLRCLSIQAAWQQLAAVLSDAGIVEAQREATIILQHVTGQSATAFYSDLQRPLRPGEADSVDTIVRRRLLHEPLQYILNSAFFYGREFYVDAHVLIPRPETELLIETLLTLSARWPDTTGHPLLADVGTGSGIIAITLALELPGARVLAIDASSDALGVAWRNAARHGVQDRTRLLQGDLLSFARGESITAIVANLPYVRSGDIAQLSPEVSQYEPRGALDGGTDGLDFISRLCRQASDVLPRGGLLLLEVGEGQVEAVLSLLEQQLTWDALSAHRDLQGIDRVVSVRRAG